MNNFFAVVPTEANAVGGWVEVEGEALAFFPSFSAAVGHCQRVAEWEAQFSQSATFSVAAKQPNGVWRVVFEA